jgi:hypothetical protein
LPYLASSCFSMPTLLYHALPCFTLLYHAFKVRYLAVPRFLAFPYYNLL